jgi:serine/threonine-protein kinase
MASVHLARMDGPGGFQKWVAIKRIHSHLVEDDTFIHMFLDEARVAARISHPNVATVFELGKHEDTYWIAMEYLHGEPLREVMRRTEEMGQPMPPEIACRVIADAAEGLHAAHELLGKNGEKLNLVHRDVTPHNLFVTYDGTTKVVDFGIAKFSSRMSNTRAGTLKGKLAYMSPEQVHGETLDRRTDIFALGVVLWELTTGQRLFRMDSDLDTLAKVQECNVPRPSSIVRGYPIDLEKIVMKALAKNRGERFKTAREFSRALQSLLMRRGLFIASDEVAGYVQAIFQDRIKKREAHLRWAADVTQTINIEQMLAPSPIASSSDASEISYSGEVQPAAATTSRHGAVRPAAGVPAGRGASSPPEMRKPQLSQQSAPTNPRPGARPVETLRPPAKAGGARTSLPPPPPPPQERHPAYDEGPTIKASPQARAVTPANLPSFEAEDDDFDDNDDTIVTTTRIDGVGPSNFPPAAGKPSTVPPPAAGRPPEKPAFAAPPRSAPPRAAHAAPLPPVVVNAPPQPPEARRSTAHVDQLLAEALAERQPLAPPAPPAPPPARPLSEAIDDALRLPRMTQPTAPRLFAPPLPDMRTDTARAVRRPPPMWLVAVVSGLAALFVAGIVIAIATHLPRTAAVAPTAAPAAPAPAQAAKAQKSGPFGAARAAFSDAIEAPTPAPGPTSAAPPVPAPDAPATAAADTAVPSPAPDPTPTAAAAAPTPVIAAAVAAPAPVQHAAPPRPRPAPAPAAAPPPPEPDPSGGDRGLLTIICFPACDAVVDNGRALGASPIFRRAVPVGEHRLTLKSSNPSVTKTVSIIVMAGETKTVRQPMTP